MGSKEIYANRQELWNVLKKLGIPDKMLNVIIFHEGIKSKVASRGESSSFFALTNLTKQGCVMVPVFFAIFFFFSVMLRYDFSDIQSGVNYRLRVEHLVDYSIVSVSIPETTTHQYHS